MTDEDVVERVLRMFEPQPGNWVRIRRNEHILLALPPGRMGALRALRLYQPQRFKARATIAALRYGAGLGCHRWLLPVIPHRGGTLDLEPNPPQAIPYTTGILLGSPEHRVRRAIASYQTIDGSWEVAKIAFGAEGAGVLGPEAEVLASLAGKVAGVPQLLGLHCGSDATVMRMPYLTGQRLKPGKTTEALALLNGWIFQAAAKPMHTFPEWPAIELALGSSDAGQRALAQLADMKLHPVIRHGDFARWNLRRRVDGSLVVLDWEWGHPEGMPGLDLVHFFLQDARLVNRLPHAGAIAKTAQALQHSACAAYLAKTGWVDDPLLPIIASLAWKQEARHQENAEVLEAALSAR